MIKVEWIVAGMLTEQQWLAIGKACEQGWDRNLTTEFLARQAHKGGVYFHHFTGDGVDLMFVTRPDYSDMSLVILLVFGRGYFKHFPTIHEKLKRVAADLELTQLCAYISSPGMKRLHERWTKAKPITTLYSEDI